MANRIAKARFSLDGKTYQPAANDGPNALHGGLRGFDKVLWTLQSVTQGATGRTTVTYLSPDGEEGYPRSLRVTAVYALNEQGELSVDYSADTDRPTIVNITNHTYFNLDGPDSPDDVMPHLLQTRPKNTRRLTTL